MIDYNFSFDQWLLTYDPATAPEAVDDGITPEEPFTAQAFVSYLPSNCGVGLYWRSAGNTYYWLARLEPAEEEPPFLNVLVSGPIWLRLEYDDEVATLSSSPDQVAWTYHRDILCPETPDQVGVVLVPDAEVAIVEQASITEYRLFNEVISPDPAGGLPTQQLDVLYLASDPQVSIGTFDVGDEPIVHGLIGSQFGDLEVDIGKSAIWLQALVDDLFITDINTGEQRYWVVNWSATLPEARHNITGRNFFVNPVVWRKEQFAAADKAWNYGDDDWCVFIDGCECLSFDTRSLPDDFEAQFLRSWVYREIERVEAAGQTIGYLPFFAYLKYSDLQNVTYPAATQLNTGDADAITQAISVPWYLPYRYLARLIKVSALRNPAFNWALIDTPTQTPPYDVSQVKAQVVTYGYMHWNRLDINPGYVEVEELNAANDDGYRMRCLLSMARPIPDIPYGGPYGEPWYPLSADPVSYPGPWAVDKYSTLDPNLALTIEERGHTPAHVSTAGVRVPMYDTVVRLNLRDGLWYEAGVSGNIPLLWDDTQQVWVPGYSPDQWEEMGVDADGMPEPPPSKTVLRMTGAVGTYTRTSDSAYLDHDYGFTITATLAPNDWTPPTRRMILSKWGAVGQRSYYWALDPDGLVLATSRDGTAFTEHKLVYDLAIFGDGEMVELAVSFATDPTSMTDRTVFWQYVNDAWVPLNLPLTAPNPTYLRLFNSTAFVEVGSAELGTVGNFAGRFRLVSLRTGVGEDTVGGTEQARMRGDLEKNPAYDIYGNTWTNFGGCTYEQLP